MIDFQFIKEESDNGIDRRYYGSSYQGGFLLRTTAIHLGSITEVMIDLPMCEMYKKTDGTLDIRRMNFCMTQTHVDLGFHIPEEIEHKEEEG